MSSMLGKQTSELCVPGCRPNISFKADGCAAA
jgi:hypothetical protein